MTRRSGIPKEEFERLHQEHLSGKTLKDLSTEFNVNYNTLRNGFIRLELPITINFQETSRICIMCEKEKDISNFRFRNPEKTSRRTECNSCLNKKQSTKRKSLPEKEYLRLRGMKIKKKYGISLQDYDRMYKEQDGKCMICRNPYELLNIDHCHESKKVRGLLCTDCNQGLGNFKDNPELLLEGAVYLKLTGTDKYNKIIPNNNLDTI